MKLHQVEQGLCEVRNNMLIEFGKTLLAEGLHVDDPAFAAAMLVHAHVLERWRRRTLTEIMGASGTVH